MILLPVVVQDAGSRLRMPPQMIQDGLVSDPEVWELARRLNNLSPVMKKSVLELLATALAGHK